MTTEEIVQKINNAPRVDFGDIFSRAFDIFQKVWGQGLLMQVLIMAISWGVSMVIMIPFSLVGAFIDSTEINYSSGQEVSFVAIGFMIIMYLIMAIILSVVSFALQADFYRIVRLKDRNKRDTTGVGFGMFVKKQYIKKLVVLSIFQIGISAIAVLLFILPIFFVIVPLQFAIVIFAFNPEWSVNDIYKAAFSLGTKKWAVTFGTCLVLGILALITGFMACFVGVYATISIVYLPAYLIYKDVVGFTEDDDLIAQIGV